ncbi:MAG: hypothetical protein CL904_06590 [Dehalococcoidia bacterium]|nr:hypothetical protein [Dehalococcoidia bacterium]
MFSIRFSLIFSALLFVLLWSNISCQTDDIQDVYIQPTFTNVSEDESNELSFDFAEMDTDINNEINVAHVTPFLESSSEILSEGNENWNDRPGVAVFDFDNDNDLDLYITQKAKHSNRLYRNDGTGVFTDIAKSAGVELISSHSTGVMTCDINNDGLPDIYVGAWGDPEDQLDFRSPSDIQGNADTLFLNQGEGKFLDISEQAFGESRNIRSATSISCTDINNDGWLDLYVANVGAHDFRTFNSPSHPGHVNFLYLNNRDLTFTEIASEVGLAGSQIRMRSTSGEPILFEDPKTGEMFEGWDPTRVDRLGNQVGEPVPQTHSTLFFDFDDDLDVDLFMADDGDTLKIYKNDSTKTKIIFTEVGEALGIDYSGAWMGFALGDYDGDLDLDVFVTNIGSHAMLRKPQDNPTGSCEYHQRFAWGTCANFMLRNDGVGNLSGIGQSGIFTEVGSTIKITPNKILAPEALKSEKIYRSLPIPTGIAAYEFGFGTTFFDLENDGDLDLYWLGSNKNMGAGPGGDVYPGVGRLLRNTGSGDFEDITVEARILDIADVDYSVLDISSKEFNPQSQRISPRFHENGKGVAHGDLNGDGYVDIVGTNSSGNIWTGDFENLVAAPGPVFIWLNGGGKAHWITLKLKGRMSIDGTGSNADGIGARVNLSYKVFGSSDTHTQVKEVYAGGSYLSQDSIWLEFGLASANLIEEISILWPSGREQIIRNVSVDQILEIIEPESS